MTTYIIITEERIYHEGDERSRTDPGHGYPAWTQVVKKATTYESHEKFQAEVERLVKRDDVFVMYKAEQLHATVTTTVDIK